MQQNLSAACWQPVTEKNNQSLSPSTGSTETLHIVAYLGVLKINQNMTKVGRGTFIINDGHLEMDGVRRFVDVCGKFDLHNRIIWMCLWSFYSWLWKLSFKVTKCDTKVHCVAHPDTSSCPSEEYAQERTGADWPVRECRSSILQASREKHVQVPSQKVILIGILPLLNLACIFYSILIISWGAKKI